LSALGDGVGGVQGHGSAAVERRVEGVEVCPVRGQDLGQGLQVGVRLDGDVTSDLKRPVRIRGVDDEDRGLRYGLQVLELLPDSDVTTVSPRKMAQMAVS
jgi:hypothetical protein